MINHERVSIASRRGKQVPLARGLFSFLGLGVVYKKLILLPALNQLANEPYMKSRNNLNRTVVILGCSSLLCASLTNVVLLDPTPLTHLEHAMELQAEDKLRAPLIVMTGGERPVDEAEIARSKANEIARTGNDFDLSGKSVTTEFDLLRETAALKLGITDDEWQNFSGDDPTVPHDQGFHTEYRIARAYKNGQEILITSAPMLDEDRYSPNGTARNRANTIDSLLMIGETMGMGHDTPMRACVVTNAVFTRFQGAAAKRP